MLHLQREKGERELRREREGGRKMDYVEERGYKEQIK